MGDKTGIEWTDATWNPIAGCTPVSPACTHCYAMRTAARLARMSGKTGVKYAGLTTPTKSGPVWTGEVRLDDDGLLQPLHWKRPRRIFVNSMSDLFHESVPTETIDLVFAVMERCPQHIFQILTKRPARMRDYMRDLLLLPKSINIFYDQPPTANLYQLPPKNIWLGVTAEDQPRADERIPILLDTPAAVRFVSCEPLLGPIDLNSNVGGTLWIGGQRGCNGHHRHGGPSPHNHGEGTSMFHGNPRVPHHHHDDRCRKGLDWVITGGESGPRARPSHPDWFRALRDQCNAGGTPFLFKQWGEWAPHVGAVDGWTIPDNPEISRYDHLEWDERSKGWGKPFKPAWCDWDSLDENQVVSRIGKKRAGRILDGRTHDAFPEG